MAKNRLRQSIGGAAVIAMIAVTAACGSSEGSDGDTASGTKSDICPTDKTTGKVTLTYSSPLPVFAPLLMAQATNAFDKTGLDVTIKSVPTADGRPLLAQGKIDGQVTSYTSANYNMVDTGVDLKFIAPLDNQKALPVGTPAPGFWGRKDVVGEPGNLDLTKIKGGKVVGPTGTSGASALILQDALKPFDMELSDVKVGDIMQSPDGLIALENKAVALAWISAPLEVEAAKNANLVPVAGYAPGVTGTVLLAGPSLLDRPEVAVRVMQVLSDVTKKYLKGDYRQDPESLALMSKVTGLPEATVKASEALTFDPTFSLDGVDEYLTNMQSFLKAQGELEFETPLPTDKLVDPTIVEALASCKRP